MLICTSFWRVDAEPANAFTKSNGVSLLGVAAEAGGADWVVGNVVIGPVLFPGVGHSSERLQVVVAVRT
jgi:hypothetical protein